ncbi:MAG: benzoate/H(+) symporter BenE family transporter [Rhodoluna sp.]|nr:benzoate/H(+) symporter BenE family transporter [Rhodoluna sp.]MBP7818971.1 benzoate/H(+) symporter BenE family transporter [Rhodoluna sp.]
MGRFSDHKAPILAGSVASITGTAASAGLVLTALRELGASESQTASAIFVLIAMYGLLSIGLSWRFKMPISIVWSTPGAALLISSGALGLPFSSAVGAFIFAGVLLLLTGLWPALGRLVSSIPRPIASAMLAGVIFNFCIAPFKSAAEFPWIVLPAILVWLILYKFATVWATPAAMVIIFTLTAIDLGITVNPAEILPTVEFVSPTFDITAIVSIGIPLYLVTMASQNIPGIAIMKSFGYEVPFKPVMAATGVSAVVAGFFGGFSMNLAAITAALNANDHAHKDPARRWLSSVYGGYVYLLIALFTGATVAFVLQAPRDLVLAAAGIALLGTIISALSTAVEVVELRLPAMVTFLVTASGLSAFGVGSAFWALIAGLIVWGWLNFRSKAK